MVIRLDDDDYMRFLSEQNGYDHKDVDPVYKVFLEHLREDGKSYVFAMTRGDHASPTIIKYENRDEFENNEVNTRRISGNIPSERGESSLNDTGLQKSSSRSGEVVDRSSSPNDKPDPPLVEESYLNFLSHLKLTDNSMVFELDSVSIRYEKERESSELSETLPSEANFCSDEQGLVPYKPSDLTVYEDGKSSMAPLESLDCCELTDFKTKLMIIISKPFDQVEYEDLLHKATERKPLTKQKHLRSMSISYATKEEGQSYLDYFPDLAEQISSADFPTKLNLLRGFFFWLKNLSQEGAYMPWAPSGYEVIAADDYDPVLPLDMARD